jgi:pimeloyl-ACP methyl ester carboxylesterase
VPAEDLAHAERLLEVEIAQLTEMLAEPPPPRTAPRAGRAYSSFVSLDGLQIHLRRRVDQSGRTLIVQHSALESTRCIEPLLAALGDSAPLLAIDLPGRGLSDEHPGTGAADVAGDARVLGEVVRSLGLEGAGFVGWRTGASVGLELAGQRPGLLRNLMAVQPCWPEGPPGPDELARLVPPWSADAAGTHLMALWHQLRDAELQQPWYERRLAAAVRHHEPDLEPPVIQARLEARLRCGTRAADYWRAALAYPALRTLEALCLPSLIAGADPGLASRIGARSLPHCRLAGAAASAPAALASTLLEFDRSCR